MRDKKIDEKPKAVVEMEENSDAGKARKRQEERINLSIRESNKKFFIKFGVFIVILALITAGAIYFTINNFTTKDEEKSTIVEKSVEKPIAQDIKYAINSYSETYDENSIIIEHYDIEGNKQDNENSTGFIQISGLLNKNVEEMINKKLKQKALDVKGTSNYVFSNITANFGNILSVSIYSKHNSEFLNIDLNTGKDILFKDIFVSSAPLNSIIMEGAFQTLAWDKLEANYEKIDGTLDMEKVDTSNYEDIALKVVNNYKNKKQEDIKYYITPSAVFVYDLVAPSFLENSEYEHITEISFRNHKEEIAIYKRFLSNNSIYESDSVGTKGIIIFTSNLSNFKDYKNILYEKTRDNIFIEEALIYWDKTEQTAKSNIESYINNLAETEKQNLIAQVSDNVGMFFQREYYMINFDTYFKIITKASKTTCDISYYNENGFKDYIEMKNTSFEAEFSLCKFTEYDRKRYPYLSIIEEKETELYFDKEGNFIGNDEKEAKAKTQSKSNSPEEKPRENNTEFNKNINTNDNTINNSNSNVSNTNTNTNTKNTNTSNKTENNMNITNTEAANNSNTNVNKSNE